MFGKPAADAVAAVAGERKARRIFILSSVSKLPRYRLSLNSERSEPLDCPTVPLTTDHAAIPNIPVIFPIRGLDQIRCPRRFNEEVFAVKHGHT